MADDSHSNQNECDCRPALEAQAGGSLPKQQFEKSSGTFLFSFKSQTSRELCFPGVVRHI